MIQNTVYNLELHLRRIDENMARLHTENVDALVVSIDLKDEKEVTKQCLRICEDAKCYLASLSERSASLLPDPPQNAVEETPFEAQVRTRQAFADNRDSFTATISYLQTRLNLLLMDENPDKADERSRLMEDINVSKQCIDVCKMASEVSRQKVYRIGEVIAQGDSDQVVVTTLADLFDIKKALSKDNSAQLVGSMTAENLHYLTEKRYSSRFGTLTGQTAPSEADITTSSAAVQAQQSKSAPAPQLAGHEQPREPRTRQDRPSPNEMRKRVVEDAVDQDTEK